MLKKKIIAFKLETRSTSASEWQARIHALEVSPEKDPRAKDKIAIAIIKDLGRENNQDIKIWQSLFQVWGKVVPDFWKNAGSIRKISNAMRKAKIKNFTLWQVFIDAVKENMVPKTMNKSKGEFDRGDRSRHFNNIVSDMVQAKVPQEAIWPLRLNELDQIGDGNQLTDAIYNFARQLRHTGVQEPEIWLQLISKLKVFGSVTFAHHGLMGLIESLVQAKIQDIKIWEALFPFLDQVKSNTGLRNCIKCFISGNKEAKIQNIKIWAKFLQLLERKQHEEDVKWFGLIHNLALGMANANIQDFNLWNRLFQVSGKLKDKKQYHKALGIILFNMGRSKVHDINLWRKALQISDKLSLEKDQKHFVVRIAFAMYDAEFYQLGLWTQLLDRAIMEPSNRDFLNISIHIQKSTAEEKWPDLLENYLSEQQKDLIGPLKEFKAKVQEVNLGAIKHQKIDTQKLLGVYQFQILGLCKIMGKDAFLLLNECLATSAQPLFRFLDEISTMDSKSVTLLSQLYQRHNYKKNKNEWKQLLQQYAGFVSVWDVNAFLEEIMPNKKPVAKNLKALVSRLNNILLERFLKKIGINEHINTESLSGKFPIHYISQLLEGQDSLESYPERLKVFTEMIKDGFKSKKKFSSFILNGDKNSEVGERLAGHNQKVLRAFKKANIQNPKAYYLGEYPPKNILFNSPLGESDNNLSRIKASIQTHIKIMSDLLIEHVKTNSDKKSVAAKLCRFMEKKVKQMNKNFLNPKNLNAFTKFKKHLDGHWKVQESTRQTSTAAEKLKTELGTRYSSFFEHAKHVNDDYEMYQEELKTQAILKKQKKTKPASKTKKAKRWHKEPFTMRVWQRKPLRDLFLGLDVNCCLAPNGGEFQAIVERLMDVGMAVIEITNQAVKTVALSWVFLGIDKNNHDKPHLVSNFHEMSNQFAGVPEIRDFLIKNLTEYSKDLSKHLGVDYLIRPLTYGMIPDFEGLELKEGVRLEKIGGYYPIGDDEDSDSTPEYLREVEDPNYYLESLKLRKFWIGSQVEKELTPSKAFKRALSEKLRPRFKLSG